MQRINQMHVSIERISCLPYSEREIKIEGFGGRPGALGPMDPPLNPALRPNITGYKLQ